MALPSISPKQVTPCDVKVFASTAGSLKVILPVSVQPFKSVTVTLCVPALNALFTGPVRPLLQT